MGPDNLTWPERIVSKLTIKQNCKSDDTTFTRTPQQNLEMMLPSCPVTDCFSPRFRTPNSIAQRKYPFHYQNSTTPSGHKKHDSTQTKFNSIYCNSTVQTFPYFLLPGSIFFYYVWTSYEQRETGHEFSLFVRIRRAAIDSGPTRSSAPRYCTVALRLALGASGAHIFIVFSLKRSDAADARTLKATRIGDLHPHAYYK